MNVHAELLKVPLVLVVEDELDLAEIWSDQLVENGYKTMKVSKLSEATGKLKNQRFDCILMDMNLEQGSGERLIELIRGDKGNYNFSTPVIVTSGNLEPELITRIRKSVSKFLVKPFSTNDLVSSVKSLCPIPHL